MSCRLAAFLALAISLNAQTLTSIDHFGPPENTGSGTISRQAWQNLETNLTGTSVKGSFRKLFTCSVDGAIYGQILYIPSITVSGKLQNVAYVATSHDNAYLFNVDGTGCVQLWTLSMGTAVNCNAIQYTADSQRAGALATAAYDGTYIYQTAQQSDCSWKLYKITATTGAATSVTISASLPGLGDQNTSGSHGACVFGSYLATDVVTGGFYPFLGLRHVSRAGLTVSGGKVLIGFTSANDDHPWHGLLFAYNTSDLSQAWFWNVSPDSYGGGLWHTRGVLVDASGNILFSTGNGDSAGNGYGHATDYGDEMVALNSSGVFLGSWQSPGGQAPGTGGTGPSGGDPTPCQKETADSDDSVGGPIMLPNAADTSGYSVVWGGKSGYVYVAPGSCLLANTCTTGNVLTFAPSAQGGAWAMAYGNGFLYVAALNRGLYKFAWNSTTGVMTTTAAASNTSFGTTAKFPGLVIEVSSNGAGSEILWILSVAASAGSAPTAQVLQGLSTANLSTVYTSQADVGYSNKFTIPTLTTAGGRVLVPTFAINGTYNWGFNVYGLSAPFPAPVASPAPKTAASAFGVAW